MQVLCKSFLSKVSLKRICTLNIHKADKYEAVTASFGIEVIVQPRSPVILSCCLDFSGVIRLPGEREPHYRTITVCLFWAGLGFFLKKKNLKIVTEME